MTEDGPGAGAYTVHLDIHDTIGCMSQPPRPPANQHPAPMRLTDLPLLADLPPGQHFGRDEVNLLHARLPLQRRRARALMLCNAHGVDNYVARLVYSVRRYRVKIGGREDPAAAPLHLLELVAALHVPHEEDNLQRLDVGSHGDHVHRNGDARVEGVAEAGEQILRPDAAGFIDHRQRRAAQAGQPRGSALSSSTAGSSSGSPFRME